MTWEEHYRLYQDARKHRGNEAFLQMKSARKRVSQNTPDDWQWLITALSDPEWDRRFFVAQVFRFQQLPKRLFIPMLRAGVLERDPSLNRCFIDPCGRSYGSTRVCTVLLTYLETGSNDEKAGAASAPYWAWQWLDGDLSELHTRMRAAMLREFVHNEDLQVRRRIIPMLEFLPFIYPLELRPLVAIATKIAWTHPDEYIRHRVRIQLGLSSGPFMAIPHTQ